MPEVLQRVIAYGFLGVLIEVVFTGCSSLIRRNWNATSTTYLWMIPIYGFGGWLMETTNHAFDLPGWISAVIYTVEIFAVEFVSGFILRKAIKRCPWDYGAGKYTIMGLIRLDYFPFWYILSLGAHYFHPIIIRAVNKLSQI